MTRRLISKRWSAVPALLIVTGLAACAGNGFVAQPTADKPANKTFGQPFPRVSHSEQQCLALNLYWEARGEGRAGMLAVGWTVLNRVNSPQFPATVCGVVYQGGERPPCQFSWWCDGKSDRPREQHSWTAAVKVSSELLRRPPPDPTKGALFYHNTSIRSPWKRPREQTARIGRHIFYR